MVGEGAGSKFARLVKGPFPNITNCGPYWGAAVTWIKLPTQESQLH